MRCLLNQTAILGGRNIGDEYMGLNSAFNFHDLDVLGIGPVARQASIAFDAYWNSDWVMPASALDIPVSPAELVAGREELMQRLTETESLSHFPIPPQSWSDELAALRGNLHIGTSRVSWDQPKAGAIQHVMLEQIRSMLAAAQRELLIINAYIIPMDRGIAVLRELRSRGVDVKILTNSLASHDVPAVNSYYKQWRKPILEPGGSCTRCATTLRYKHLFPTPPPRARNSWVCIQRQWLPIANGSISGL
jgi:putative cardiolipin synthase